MGVVKFLRDSPPAHFKIKLESFTSHLAGSLENYETECFEAGGYTWSLNVYPGGKQLGGEGHISMYLTIVGKSDLPAGWEVNVNFKMFVYNFDKDQYYTIQDNDKLWRFHDVKSTWGHDKLITIDEVLDRNSGYLHDDSVILGVEVFVVNHTDKGESLSIVENPEPQSFTWEIPRISSLDAKEIFSDEFNIGGEEEWKLVLFPKGATGEGSKSVSLFLSVADRATFPQGKRFYVLFNLHIKNQNGQDVYAKEGKAWFSAKSSVWGFRHFIPFNDLHNVSKGFVKNDTLVVVGQFTILSKATDF